MTTDRQHPSAPAHAAEKAYRKASGQAAPDWSLLEHYMPLVKSIVARMRIYFPSGVDSDDLYSIGISGLVTAVRRCDPEKTESFASYAALRIKGAILDELRRLDWIPRSDRLLAKKLHRVLGELEQNLGRPVSEAEAAEAMGMSVPQYQRLLDTIRPVTFISLDSPAGGNSPSEGEGAAVHEVVADSTEPDARDRMERRETIALLKERIQLLPDLPKKVLMMYYYEGMRLAEIAEVFGLTESRICQIHSQAVLSLRTYLDRAAKS
jgi:RNA polymerase sigma factor for flagellar operon FliA